MGKTDNLKDLLTDIADAIRRKTNSSGLINPQDFSARISSIQASGESTELSKDYLTVMALDNELTVSLSLNDCEYSIDGCVTWNPLAAGIETPSINAGDYISFKAKGLIPDDTNGIGTFTISKKCMLLGNCFSMLYGDNARHETSAPRNCFRNLFYECSNIVVIEKNFLPATTVAEYCYFQMFRYCTSLVNAPELPATTVGDYGYAHMFRDCTGLLNAPVISATSIGNSVCRNMFRECNSLINAPVLPATTVGDYGYGYMFIGCTSLVTAPELPAKTVGNYGYVQMFYGCTSLTTVPSLLVTSLGVYGCSGMFINCTSLVNAPELLVRTLVHNCYQQMFWGCSSLKYIKAMFTTTPSTNYMNGWVNGVASIGIFVKNAEATWTNTFGTSAIPTGWTVETAEA